MVSKILSFRTMTVTKESRNYMPKALSGAAVWFPAIRAGTGADVFTERLVGSLRRRGLNAAITWLPHRAEYLPWTVGTPQLPGWATIVHVNSWLHRRFVSFGLPLVATLHGCVHDAALDPYKSLLQRYYHRHWIKRIESKILRRADAVTAVSRYTSDQAARVFGRGDILPIHNWIDLQRFSPDQRREPRHPFRLLFAGKPSRRKGADLLPEIMRGLGPEYELHYTARPEEIPSSRGLPANMMALGRIDDEDALIRAYRDSDVLLFPTRLEGLSLVTLEAQACGLPIIGTDCSSMTEVVENGKTGLICPVDDVPALAKAVKTLKDTPHLWSKMKIAARQRIEKFFDEDTAISSYIDIYKRVTRGKKVST